MTRINCGIPVENLTKAHLIAEHREIKRIPNVVRKSKFDNLPKKFKLGEGHVKFFYDKGLYTFNRYKQLYQECLRRGVNVTDFSGAWDVYKEDQYAWLFNDYQPTQEDVAIVSQRIIERKGTV